VRVLVLTNEQLYIIYSSFVLLLNRNVLMELWRRSSIELHYVSRNLYFRLCNCSEQFKLCVGNVNVLEFASRILVDFRLRFAISDHLALTYVLHSTML